MYDLAPLLYWISEREKIRIARIKELPPPWTADPILREYRFCNIRRADDRVSRWLLKHVLTAEQLHAAGETSYIMFTALCRWINWPPTIAAIMDKGLWPKKCIDWPELVALMERRGRYGAKVWTGAYNITACGVRPGQSKVAFIVDDVLRAGLGGILPKVTAALKTRKRQEVWGTLITLNNWGSFMAGQVVDDWTWTPLLWGARDSYSWAPQGPGSLRGLNRVLKLPLKTSHNMEAWCTHLCTLRAEVTNQLGREYANMTLHDLQNCLCEYSKYAKAKEGSGRPRSIYRPEKEYAV